MDIGVVERLPDRLERLEERINDDTESVSVAGHTRSQKIRRMVEDQEEIMDAPATLGMATSETAAAPENPPGVRSTMATYQASVCNKDAAFKTASHRGPGSTSPSAVATNAVSPNQAVTQKGK